VVDLKEGQKSAEQVYESHLLNFVICPYSGRLHQFLTDIFTELNFPEKVFKDLKEAKKLKRKKNLSAAKKTPAQNHN